MTAAIGVLFDMDGLLIDSEPLWTVAEKELMRALGGEWDASLKPLFVGRHIDSSAELFLEITGSDKSPEWVVDYLLTRVSALFRQELPLMPGVTELLDELGRRGVPLAVVSASHRVLVDAALEDLGAERFTVTIAGDEVSAAKPDPEAYLKAAAALGVESGSCVVIEDSALGVAAGEAAGCVVLAVPSVASIAAAPRRYVVASLEGIDVDWLLALPSVVTQGER
ncbi:MAG: HAD family phosphatase [Actinomycetota bacterium]